MVQEDIYNEDASFCVSEHFVLRNGNISFCGLYIMRIKFVF